MQIGDIENSTFEMPTEVVTFYEDGKHIFLYPTKPDWIVTNRNGAILLSKCNGKLKIRDILDEIGLHGDERNEAVEFVLDIVKTDFFNKNDPAHSRDITNKLRSVHLNITSKCNLNCTFCYATQRPNGDSRLSVGEFESLLKALQKINSPLTIAFTGGEPLLHKDYAKLAWISKGVGNSNYLLTNGTLISRENVKEIVGLFDLIKVSVDGFFEDTHDAHRGKGTFKQVMRAIGLLQEHCANLRIAMTVTRKNISEIEKMAERFGRLLTYQPLFNAGSARLNRDLTITGQEYFSALDAANGVSPIQDVIVSLSNARNKGIEKCAMGDGEISVAENGDVYPCHMLHDPYFRAGNILEQDISEIYFNSPKLKNIRQVGVDRIDGCRDCAIKYICGGGCRARAFYSEGSIEKNDNFCDYERSAYIKSIFDSVEISNSCSSRKNCSSCSPFA